MIMSEDIKTKIAEWVYERGKEWIDKSDLRNLDRTALIFVSLLEELESDLAEKLYQHYNG